MTTLITADHYAATSQAVEAAIAASIAGETVEIECLRASTREAIEAELHEACEGVDGSTYSGECDDPEDDDVRARWSVRVIGG